MKHFNSLTFAPDSTEEAAKGNVPSNRLKRTLNENELISQLIVFFVAGKSF